MGHCPTPAKRYPLASGYRFLTRRGTISTICGHVLGLDDRQMPEVNYTLANCSVTKLLYQPDRVTLSYLNNYAHLEWLGQPNSITYR